MGGRGASSASAVVETNREGFRKLAESAEHGTSVQARSIARTARAAESLVGTERAATLLANENVMVINNELASAFRINGSRTLSNIEAMVEGGRGRPLGYSAERWENASRIVQESLARIEGDGFTVADVAAAIVYKNRLIPSRR